MKQFWNEFKKEFKNFVENHPALVVTAIAADLITWTLILVH